MREAVLVSTLLRYVKSRIDVDPKLSALRVKGEVSNFVAHRSGHYYFTLKDENARISCVMFSSKVRNCSVKLKDGMGVVVTGNVSVYENNGAVQLYAESIEEDGIGDLYKKYEELKKKMLAEGLFDVSHKKDIPLYPFRIGVLSAKEGAATQDVITTITRRWPVCEIHFYPTFVQGDTASSDIVANLQLADLENYDVILLVRGGGSIEDLWAFNKEEVVRCVYNCVTPIITGVGHETDTTLVDYASDKRAPTPTAAAELATPNIIEVKASLKKQETYILSSMERIVRFKKQQFERLKAHPYITDPHLKIHDKRHQLAMLTRDLWQFPEDYKSHKMSYQMIREKYMLSGRHLINNQQNQLDNYKKEMRAAIQTVYRDKVSALHNAVGLLDAYSPLKLLQKGYTLTYSNDKMIKRVKDLRESDELKIRYIDGHVTAKIMKVEEISND